MGEEVIVEQMQESWKHITEILKKKKAVSCIVYRFRDE